MNEDEQWRGETQQADEIGTTCWSLRREREDPKVECCTPTSES